MATGDTDFGEIGEGGENVTVNYHTSSTSSIALQKDLDDETNLVGSQAAPATVGTLRPSSTAAHGSSSSLSLASPPVPQVPMNTGDTKSEMSVGDTPSISTVAATISPTEAAETDQDHASTTMESVEDDDPLSIRLPDMIRTKDNRSNTLYPTVPPNQPRFVRGVDSDTGSDRDGSSPEFSRRASRIVTKKLKHRKQRMGETIYKGHRSFDLMINLQMGIRVSVGSISAKKQAGPPNFTERKKLEFPKEGSHETPPHSSPDFKFKDYCPGVFKNLRERFGIDAADYMVSLCGDQALAELSTPGKSGALFYFSENMEFILKTVSKLEGQCLQRILHAYYDHMMANQNSLLPRFYGFHRIKVNHRKIRVLVMNNIFDTERIIHERYDLKGSTVGRKAKESELRDPSCTRKDLDFLQKGKKIAVGTRRAELLKAQLAKDAEFLSRNDIMDYSLLLGVHDRTRLDDVTPGVDSSHMRRSPSPAPLQLINADGTPGPSTSNAAAIALVNATMAAAASSTAATAAPSTASSTGAAAGSSVSSMSSSVVSGGSTSAVGGSSSSSSAPTAPSVSSASPVKAASSTSGPSGKVVTVAPTNVTLSLSDLLHSAPTGKSSVSATAQSEAADSLASQSGSVAGDDSSVGGRMRPFVGRGRTISIYTPKKRTHISEFQKEDGGIASISAEDGNSFGEEIFFLGIIDILQEYTMRKRLETFGKGLKYEKDKISAVHPKLYKRRFLEFLVKLVE